ncbi:MAG: alpha/beta hydrolase [Eubacteriaceae bacterium]|jgi:fermentation-respiration switch protein FrsA (DUF1100 family)|nr:alpha/beta hydrolase [Eubacteriaceae bacterium]
MIKIRSKGGRKILIGVLALLLSATLLAFVWIGNQFYDGGTILNKGEETIDNSKKHLKQMGFDQEAFLEKYSGKSFTTASSFHDHDISGTWLQPDHTKKRPTVIMVHGLGGDHTTVFPIATLFLEKGYNVVAYDQRNSGHNTASRNGFMHLESDDLADIVAMVQKENAEQPVVLWGTSYGGGTVAIGLGKHNLRNSVSGVVLDCPLSSMTYMIRLFIADMHLDERSEAFMMGIGSWMTKIRMGIGYNELEVVDYVQEAELPVLIFSSKNDDVTPPFMAEDIYQALPEGKKTLITVEDSKHIQIFDDHPELYIKSVEQLLSEIEQ